MGSFRKDPLNTDLLKMGQLQKLEKKNLSNGNTKKNQSSRFFGEEKRTQIIGEFSLMSKGSQ